VAHESQIREDDPVKTEYIALLAAFLGALFGGGFSVLAICIQAKAEARKERLRLAAELAIKGYQSHIDLMISEGKGGRLPPLAAYLLFNIDLFKALENKGFDKDVFEEVSRKNREILDIISAQTGKEKGIV
jgi:hypothetical protein